MPTRRNNRNTIGHVARSGAMGVMSICLLFFGFFFCLPGLIMLAVGFGDEDFEDNFFDDMRWIGMGFFAVGILFVIVGCMLCCSVCRRRNTSGTVINTNTAIVSGYAPGTSTTTTTTYNPVPQGQPQYPATGPYPPSHYPQAGQQYPQQYPAAGAYPPAGQYPSYQPSPQYPAAPPHQTAPASSSGMMPSAPPSDMVSDLPPSYDSIVKQ